MKKLLSIFLSLSLLILTVNVLSALSITIKNKLKNRISLKLADGSTISLAARGSVVINEKDMNTPQLKALIQKGAVVIVSLTDKPVTDSNNNQKSIKK